MFWFKCILAHRLLAVAIAFSSLAHGDFMLGLHHISLLWQNTHLLLAAVNQGMDNAVSQSSSQPASQTPDKSIRSSGRKHKSSYHSDESSGNGSPGPNQAFHTYSDKPCPVCKSQVCRKKIKEENNPFYREIHQDGVLYEPYNSKVPAVSSLDIFNLRMYCPWKRVFCTRKGVAETRKLIMQYLQLDDKGRAEWIAENLEQTLYQGGITALQSQNHVIARKHLYTGQLLGHYRGRLQIVDPQETPTPLMEGNYALSERKWLVLGRERGNIFSLMNSPTTYSGSDEDHIETENVCFVSAHIAVKSGVRRVPIFFIVATEEISAGEGLWVDYGRDFWQPEVLVINDNESENSEEDEKEEGSSATEDCTCNFDDQGDSRMSGVTDLPSQEQTVEGWKQGVVFKPAFNNLEEFVTFAKTKLSEQAIAYFDGSENLKSNLVNNDFDAISAFILRSFSKGHTPGDIATRINTNYLKEGGHQERYDAQKVISLFIAKPEEWYGMIKLYPGITCRPLLNMANLSTDNGRNAMYWLVRNMMDRMGSTETASLLKKNNIPCPFDTEGRWNYLHVEDVMGQLSLSKLKNEYAKARSALGKKTRIPASRLFYLIKEKGNRKALDFYMKYNIEIKKLPAWQIAQSLKSIIPPKGTEGWCDETVKDYYQANCVETEDDLFSDIQLNFQGAHSASRDGCNK